MTSPQLSVRSARARDLAHQLSAREKRPIHAIVEDALNEYASKRHQPESAEGFLRRLRLNAVEGFDLVEMIADNRRLHDAVRLIRG